MIAKDPLQHPQMGTFVSEAQRCCALHDYPKAIAACKHALELDADNVNVRLLRARCNMLAGRIPESIEDTRCVLQAEPFNHRAHFVSRRPYSKLQSLSNLALVFIAVSSCVQISNPICMASSAPRRLSVTVAGLTHMT